MEKGSGPDRRNGATPVNKHIHLPFEWRCAYSQLNPTSVFPVHLKAAFYQVTRSLLHHPFQLSRPHCFPDGVIELAHFGWRGLDLLSSNFKAYNLIVGICCPTVMTKILRGINKRVRENFPGSEVHWKNWSQIYLGFSFSSGSRLISTGNPTWGSKSPNTSQCLVNVFPLVFVHLRISPWGVSPLPHGSQDTPQSTPRLLLSSSNGLEAAMADRVGERKFTRLPGCSPFSFNASQLLTSQESCQSPNKLPAFCP